MSTLDGFFLLFFAIFSRVRYCYARMGENVPIWSAASLGARLKFVRELRELTQAQLALLLNVSTLTVSAWETDRRRPDSEQLGDEYSDNTLYDGVRGAGAIPALLSVTAKWLLKASGSVPQYSKKINQRIVDRLDDLTPNGVVPRDVRKELGSICGSLRRAANRLERAQSKVAAKGAAITDVRSASLTSAPPTQATVLEHGAAFLTRLTLAIPAESAEHKALCRAARELMRQSDALKPGAPLAPRPSSLDAVEVHASAGVNSPAPGEKVQARPSQIPPRIPKRQITKAVP